MPRENEVIRVGGSWGGRVREGADGVRETCESYIHGARVMVAPLMTVILSTYGDGSAALPRYQVVTYALRVH